MNACELEFSKKEVEFIADKLCKFHEEINLGDVQALIRQQADLLKKYELRHAEQRDRIAYLEAQVYGGTTK